MTDKLVERLRELVQILVDNDPDEPVADNGCTVFDLWRPDAVKTLAALESLTLPQTDLEHLTEHMRDLVQFLIKNDPAKPAGDDGCTVFDLWRADAINALAALASSSVPEQDSWQGERSEMVEHVAKSLHAAFGPYADYTYDWDDPLASQPMFRALAKAALAAVSGLQDSGASQEDGRP